MDLQEWISVKFKEIAAKLPSPVHSEPASFACGYNVGYKQALFDLENFLIKENKDEFIKD